MAKSDKGNKKGGTKKVDSIKQKPAIPLSSKQILARAATLAEPESSSEESDLVPTSVKKKTISVDLSDTSSSDKSSSEDDVGSSKGKLPVLVKNSATAVKASETSDDSSDASNSEESSGEDRDDDKEKAPLPTKTPSHNGKKISEPEGGSSDALSSEDSSSETNSDEEDEEMTAPTPPEANKKSEINKKTPNTPPKVKESNEKTGAVSSDSSTSNESSSGSDSDEEGDEATAQPAQSIIVETKKKRKTENDSAVVPKKVKLANGSASAVTSSEETMSIFVGRLSWNVDNDWLAQEFAECGEVESAHVQMDRNTGRSRGFGYVHFKTVAAVEKALTLNGKEIDGRAVNIDKSNAPDKKASLEKRAEAFGDTPSRPSTVLFVGNLSFGVNEDMLWEAFGEHGDVKSVRIPTQYETGKPKGFAYVEFSEIGAAKTAHKALQGFELDGRSIRLDFSQPRDNVGGRGGQGGRGGRGRGGFGGDRGRGGARGARGARGGDRGGRGRGRGGRTGGITQFEGQKITFD